MAEIAAPADMARIESDGTVYINWEQVEHIAQFPAERDNALLRAYALVMLAIRDGTWKAANSL